MLYPIANLIEQQKLETITEDTRVLDALKIMIENDFSQLPVVDGKGNLKGLFSERFLTRMYYHFSYLKEEKRKQEEENEQRRLKAQPANTPVNQNTQPTPTNQSSGIPDLYHQKVGNCLEKAEEVTSGSDIFDALDKLKKSGAVLVTEQKKLKGIVTDYDATLFFRDYAEGIMICEDVEVNLRRYIEKVFGSGSPEMRSALIKVVGANKSDPSRPQKDFDELNLGQYIKVITHDDHWSQFEASLNPKEMFEPLAKLVQNSRNHLAHFRGRLNRVQLDALNSACFWLETRPKIDNSASAAVAQDVSLTAEGATELEAAVALVAATSSTQEATKNNPELNDASSELESLVISKNGNGKGSHTDLLNSSLIQQPVAAQSSSEVTTLQLPGNGKYARLHNWLRQLADDKPAIKVSFKDIETLLDEKLPPSARQHQNWWANDGVSRSQSIAWLQAGWRVDDVDFKEEKVSFSRTNTIEMQAFFRDVLTRFRQEKPGTKADELTRVMPVSWLGVNAGKPGLFYNWVWSYDSLRVELAISSDSAVKNKELFDNLLGQRVEIEDAIGSELVWDYNERRRSCRIYLQQPGKVTDTEEELEAHKTWAVAMMVKFVNVFNDRVKAF